MKYKIFVITALILVALLPFIPLISSLFRDLHVEKRREELERYYIDTDNFISYFDMPQFLSPDNDFGFTGDSFYGDEINTLHAYLVLNDFVYILEHGDTEDTLQIRCGRPDCLHENEADVRCCDAYIPNLQLFQNYYGEAHYITDTVSDKTGTVLYEGEPVLVRERIAGDHIILGTVPTDPAVEMQYAIHREWFYVFRFHPATGDFTVTRTPISDITAEPEPVFEASGFTAVTSLIYGKTLFLLTEDENGFHTFSKTPLMSNTRDILLHDENPDAEYQWITGDNNGTFYLLKTVPFHDSYSEITLHTFMPNLNYRYQESLYEYASNGKIVSAGAIMGGVYLAFASPDNPDETVLYFNESALNCITFSSATVALKDPISINVGGQFFLERNGSKLLSAGRYASISPYYRKLLYEYRPVS